MTNGKTNSNNPIDSNIPPRITEPGIETPPIETPKSSILPDPPQTENTTPVATPPEQPKAVLTQKDIQDFMAVMKANEERREIEHKEAMEKMEKAEADRVKNSQPYNTSLNQVINDRPTQLQYETKRDSMKAKWAKEIEEGKVGTIYIPKPAGEPDGIRFHIQFNGAILELDKDTYIENVPLSVVTEVRECLKQQKDAGKAARLDLNSDLQKHLDQSVGLK